jgi:galectin-9
MGQEQSQHHHHHHQQHFSVPYQQQFSPAISVGTQVHVYGTGYGDRFEVNIANNRGDVLLHVNPRLNDNLLVLNAAPGGGWGGEDRKPLTIVRGHPFSLIIMVTEHGYKIAINNQHVADFPHRMPFNAAELVSVKGDVNLTNVQIYPGYSGQHGQPWKFAMETPVPMNFFPGRTITIHGHVKHNASRFEFNLLTGAFNGADVAFHLNPRFDQRECVRNSCQGGGWGPEEKQGGFPLNPGQPFEIQITCYPDYYQVNCNHQPWFQFRHRVPYQQVQALQVKGDVAISNVYAY